MNPRLVAFINAIPLVEPARKELMDLIQEYGDEKYESGVALAMREEAEEEAKWHI